MTPAPPNNPGHQEAQGRRRSTNDPIQGGDCCFPNGQSSAESGFCHEPQCSGNTMCAEIVLNALDELLKTSGPGSTVLVRLNNNGKRSALFYKGADPCRYGQGDTVHEAVQDIVR